MRKMFVRAALLSCAALATGPAIANHSWGNYHWARTSNPLKLDVMTAIYVEVGFVRRHFDCGLGAIQVLTLTGKTATGVNAKKCTAITGEDTCLQRRLRPTRLARHRLDLGHRRPYHPGDHQAQ